MHKTILFRLVFQILSENGGNGNGNGKNITSVTKNASSTYPPDNSVTIKNENVDFIQKLRLRVAQFQNVGHLKGGGRGEGTSRRSYCRRKCAAAAKRGDIASGSEQWRSQQKFPGGSCEFHGRHKFRLLSEDQ